MFYMNRIKRFIPENVKDTIKILAYQSHFHYKHPQKNNKMVVVFLVARTNVFNSVLTIFQAADQSNDIDAYLIALPNRSNDKQSNNSKETFEFCKTISFNNVINSYNEETGKYFDLKTLNPDYVFLCAPYDEEYPDGYKFRQMANYTKLCFVPYGYGFVEGVTTDTGLNIYMLAHVKYLFADGPVTMRHCEKKLKYIKNLVKHNILNLGFPRFDLYKNIDNSNEKKHIIYLPRWSAPQNVERGHELSSFMLFKDEILNWAERHPDIDLIIRPHPILFYRYIEYGLMSENDVKDYIQRIESMPNVSLDSSPDYRKTLLWADISVSDFSSTLAEYSFTRKPLIFFGNTERIAEDQKPIFESAYTVHSWKEAEEYLEMLLSGNDPKAAERELSHKRVFEKVDRNAGRNIVNYLLEEYRK